MRKSFKLIFDNSNRSKIINQWLNHQRNKTKSLELLILIAQKNYENKDFTDVFEDYSLDRQEFPIIKVKKNASKEAIKNDNNIHDERKIQSKKKLGKDNKHPKKKGSKIPSATMDKLLKGLNDNIPFE